MSKVINLTIAEQSSFVATKRLPVAGTTGFYKVHPEFDDEWSDLARKVIVFVWSKPAKYGAPRTVKLGVEYDGENDVTIPQSVVAETGTLTIGALGYNSEGTMVITTNASEGVINVVEAVATSSADLDGDSDDAIDIWATVMAQIARKCDDFTVGDGLSMSDGREITLDIASAENVGGIKVGNNLTIDENGVLSADAAQIPLYSTTGNNTDGAIHQRGMTTLLGKKEDTLTAGTGLTIYDETDENDNTTHYIAVDTNTIASVANVPTNTSDLTNDGADGSDTYVEASDLSAVEEQIPTTVAELTDASDYVTQTELTNKLSSVYKYKGSVATYAALPSTNRTTGDVYNVAAAYQDVPAGTNWAWNGSAWDALAGAVDLSSYATTTYVDTAVGNIETLLATLTTGTGA